MFYGVRDLDSANTVVWNNPTLSVCHIVMQAADHRNAALWIVCMLTFNSVLTVHRDIIA